MDKDAKKVIPILIVVAIVVGIIGMAIFTTTKNTDKPFEYNSALHQKPEKEVKTETEIKVIPYETTTVNDGNLEYGKTETRTTGVNGEKTYTYEVTYENGKETSRELIKEEVTKQPVTKVVANGTKIVWHCVDATSYNKNPYDDNRCTSSTGETRYVSDSQSRALDPSYYPGQAGHPYYNSK